MFDYFVTSDPLGNELIVITDTNNPEEFLQKQIYPSIGITEHFKNHVRHRADGPAIESDNSWHEEGYFVDGVDVTDNVRSMMDKGMLNRYGRDWNERDIAVFKLKFI